MVYPVLVLLTGSFFQYFIGLGNLLAQLSGSDLTNWVGGGGGGGGGVGGGWGGGTHHLN
jgi:hypothetical protein